MWRWERLSIENIVPKDIVERCVCEKIEIQYRVR